MTRSFLFLALALSLTACDSGGDAADALPTCALTGTQDLGTVTATTPFGSLRTSCAAVSSSGGDLIILVRTPGDASPLGDDALEFYLQDIRVGTYTLGADEGSSSASYGRTPASVTEATSGTVSVTSLDGGIEGTFSFTTVTGQEITNGRLDLTF